MSDDATIAELQARLALTQTALEDSRSREWALLGEVDRHRMLLDTVDVALCTIEVIGQVDRDIDYRFLQVNAAFEEQTGIVGAVGQTARGLVPDHEQYWFDTFARVADTGIAERFENRAAALGRWYEVFASPVGDPALRQLVVLFRDIAERKGAEATLRAREIDLARVQRIGAVGGLDVDVRDGLRSWRSPEYLRLHGLPADTTFETHEQWRARVHPDDVDQAERTLFDALRGQSSTYDCEYRIVRPVDGRIRWIHARADIERDECGAPTRLVGAHIDVTEQKAMQAALRESEERLGFLLRLSDAIALPANSTEIAAIATLMLAQHLDTDRAWYAECAGPGRIGEVVVLAQHVRRGDPMPATFRCRTNPVPLVARTLAWPEPGQDASVGAPEANDPPGIESAVVYKGVPVALLGVHGATGRRWTVGETQLMGEVAQRTFDAVERARADAALSQSREQLSAIFQSAPVGIALIDKAGSIIVANERAQAFFPSLQMPSRDPLHGSRWRAVAPDGAEIPAEEYPGIRALQGIATVPGMEFIHTDAQGRERWTSVSSVPMRDEAEQVVGAVAVVSDIDDLKRSQHALCASEQRLQMLLAELQHRVRNILTVIRSVFSRTIEAGGDLDDVADHFRGRLDNLARTQLVAVQSASGMVDLENLIRDELLSVGAADGAKVSIDGPAIALDPVMAEGIGLALHELTTNALKYGALRFPGGRLAIHWRIDTHENDRRTLELSWTEASVPAMAARPARRGFGSELIEEALPYRMGATTRLEFRGGGVACRLSVPLPPGGNS